MLGTARMWVNADSFYFWWGWTRPFIVSSLNTILLICGSTWICNISASFEHTNAFHAFVMDPFADSSIRRHRDQYFPFICSQTILMVYPSELPHWTRVHVCTVTRMRWQQEWSQCNIRTLFIIFPSIHPMSKNIAAWLAQYC